MALHLRHRPDSADSAGLLRGLERRVLMALDRAGVPCLRLSVGLVFIWFGALKAVGASPVGALVAATVPFLDRAWFVPALGGLEMLLGIALVTSRGLRLALPVMVAHLAGTFAVLLVQPTVAFQHGNPFLLTTIGEFVVKNVVLISAGLVIASRMRQAATASDIQRT